MREKVKHRLQNYRNAEYLISINLNYIYIIDKSFKEIIIYVNLCKSYDYKWKYRLPMRVDMFHLFKDFERCLFCMFHLYQSFLYVCFRVVYFVCFTYLRT